MAKRAKAQSVTVSASGPIEGQDLQQRVVARIVDLVRTGNLRPGDRLPPERELVEIFSISRPSLREAMRALSTLGIVASRHGGGTFVTDLDARTLLAPLDFFLQLSQTNLNDTFESRRVIETEIVRQAANRARKADISELNDMITAHATVQKDPIGFRILDSRFHEKLSTIAGNALLQRIADALYNMNSLSAAPRHRRARPDRPEHRGSHTDCRRDYCSRSGIRRHSDGAPSYKY